ncbi:MAG: ABC transporter transmembrane domain-containing protein, partial [Pseudomonadota bacterium]
MHHYSSVDSSTTSPLKDALVRSRLTFWSVGLFSCAVNVLMLTGPLFMLQVYDRVLASGSVPTLVALFGLVAALFLFLGMFDFIRTKALSRAGYRLDTELSSLTNKAWIYSGLFPGLARSRPLNDLASLRQFLCSNGLPSLFDLPWVPVYLVVVYLLHFWLGVLATAGAAIVITTTIINELITKRPISEATSFELRDGQFAEASNRNAEAIIAMGMVGKLTGYWQTIRQNALANVQLAGGRSEFISAFNKAVRMLLQSGILALGAYLAILQEITPGTMIAASILGGRA